MTFMLARSLSLDQLRAFVEVVETRAKAFLASVISGLSSMGPQSETGSRATGGSYLEMGVSA
jgi:hypothetical protein